MQISLVAGEQDSVFFGTKIGASDALDPGIDVLNPPPMPGGFDGFFEISDPLFPELSFDFRSNTDSTNIWTLKITGTNGSVGTITWDASDFPIGGADEGKLEIRSGETVLADMLSETSLNFVGDQDLTISYETPTVEVVAQVNCPDAFVEICPVTVPVTIDVSGAFPGDLLGSYNATLTWDPALLEFVGFSGGDPPFDNPIVNEDNADLGELQFEQSDPTGAGGVVNVINVEFTVVGDAGLSGVLDLDFSEITTAESSNDLLAITTIEDCSFEIAQGCLFGDVTLDDLPSGFDALVIATFAVELPIPPQFLERIEQGCGDVTLEGATTGFDALVIATFAVDLPIPEQFPVGQQLCP